MRGYIIATYNDETVVNQLHSDAGEYGEYLLERSWDEYLMDDLKSGYFIDPEDIWMAEDFDDAIVGALTYSGYVYELDLDAKRMIIYLNGTVIKEHR